MNMFKKVLSLVLVIAMAATAVFGLVSCKKTNDDFKVGFIFLHDENSTYDKNFLDAAKAAAKAAGLKDDQILMKTFPRATSAMRLPLNWLRKAAS